MAQKKQIFVSHSKDDTNLEFFKSVISNVSLKGVWMEYRDIDLVPWVLIRAEMARSACVIVALSRPLTQYSYAHTRNWIDFEVGLACAMNKPVWVFEPWNEPIDFSVPFCTHYTLYEPSNENHIKFFIESFEKYSEDKPPFHPSAALQKCSNEGCSLPFFLMCDIEEYRCPSCRMPLTKSSIDDTVEHMLSEILKDIRTKAQDDTTGADDGQ